MGLNDTPAGERVHIALFGKRNAGKSSLINALTNQELAIVSEQKGTTTDPVYKAMELLPLGPVMLIDTPGLDDEGVLGELRIRKAMDVLNKTDIAVLVMDARELVGRDMEKISYQKETEEILLRIKKKQIPYVVVINQTDLLSDENREALLALLSSNDVKEEVRIPVSAVTRENIEDLKEILARQLTQEKNVYPIVKDLVKPMDFVVLVVPIDESAPKGRLILPQQQTIRELLDAGAVPVVTKETTLKGTLDGMGTKPALVITDSQAFGKVSRIVPDDIPLTSFSILMARHKGNLKTLIDGYHAVKGLKQGDRILIAEGCTHHRQCNDIGTVKIPRWLTHSTGLTFRKDTSSCSGFPEDLSEYALIIHCGGCMRPGREMRCRICRAQDQGIPIVNYGVFIAGVTGILERSIAPVLHTL